MKQGLWLLRIGQQQALAPQLQQVIRMLQLSAENLQLEVQAALESNPMLELDEAEGELLTANGEEPQAPDLDLEQVGVIAQDLPIEMCISARASSSSCRPGLMARQVEVGRR